MTPKLKDMFFVLFAAGAVLLAIFFWSHRGEIAVDFPVVTQNMIDADAAQNAKAAADSEAASRAQKRAQQARRIFACETDDQCMRVEKNPCGCSAGPEEVVAINGMFFDEFSRTLPNMTVTCPDAVSTEKECSPSARPACVQKMCKIVY